MSRQRLCYRGWLISAGVPVEEAFLRADKTVERVSRLPWPVLWGHLISLKIVDWFFPLLILGLFSRAGSLHEEDWLRLDAKMHHHWIYFCRLIFLLARLPLFEQVQPETKSPQQNPHPLQNRISSSILQKDFDVVIIGSGAGGAAVAWELSRRGFRVAIIESGLLSHPATVSDALEKYYLQQAFVASVTHGVVAALAGNTVGGTTSINSGTSLRPRNEQLKLWDTKLGTDFALGSLEIFFDEAERILGVTTPPRELLGPSAHLISKGLKILGLTGDFILPRAAPDCSGSSRCCFVCPTGAKRGTDNSFLPLAVDNGCVIFSGTTAETIRETPDGVRIETQDAAGKSILTAKHLVIAAGGLATPLLIRKNRLGTRWKKAGKKLRIHPASKVFAHFLEPVHGERGVPQGLGYRHPEMPNIVFEGIFTPLAAAVPLLQAGGAKRRFWIDNYSNVASYGFMRVDDDAKARVHCLGKFITIDYALSKTAAIELATAAKFTAEIFFAAGADRVLLPFAGCENEFTSREELLKFDPSKISASQIMASGFHPQGTAAMGDVVDNDLNLIGTKHISVSDASVLPFSPGVNPQITIMGLGLSHAHKLSKLLRSFD